MAPPTTELLKVCYLLWLLSFRAICLGPTFLGLPSQFSVTCPGLLSFQNTVLPPPCPFHFFLNCDEIYIT